MIEWEEFPAVARRLALEPDRAGVASERVARAVPLRVHWSQDEVVFASRPSSDPGSERLHQTPP